MQVANLGLSQETMDALAARNIFSLFQVQKQVLEPIMGGRDVVCRAKTGSGKTLAFALPVIESLVEVRGLGGRGTGCGGGRGMQGGSRGGPRWAAGGAVGCCAVGTAAWGWGGGAALRRAAGVRTAALRVSR